MPEFRYVSFDDPIMVERMLSDPRGFMNYYDNKVIFDEVQKVPELFNNIKICIDEDRSTYGKFILTGSSQFSMVKGISETLAGRIGTLVLLPFQFNEMPKAVQKEQMLFGSYPENIIRKFQGVREWYGSYINNYIERDVRSLYNIGNLRDFQRLLHLLAAQTAQELNMNRLSGEIGVSVKTIKAWMSVLEASYIIFFLEPYYENFGKRIVKRPKFYFYDTGLVCYLTGISSFDLLDKGPLAGPLFENYVIAELKKTLLHTARDSHLFYFRDNSGLEIDLIIEDVLSKEKIFAEIKNTSTPKPIMIEKIKKIVALDNRSIKKSMYKNKAVLVYRGKEEYDFNAVKCMHYLKFLENPI